MINIDDYVSRVEGTCGKEKDIIVLFKYEKRDETVKKILGKARMEKSISGIIFELSFRNVSIRLYGSGKAIFRNLKDRNELNSILSELLS